MNSTRFEGKVLEAIDGEPMLVFQNKRISQSRYADEVVVCTSVEKTDDKIFSICERFKIPVYRGSLNNVLDRFQRAAELYKADIVIRCNGDCPLIDPVVIDHVVENFIQHQPNVDYASNILDETYPLGMHVEVFTKEALLEANEKCSSKEEREHVTPYLYRNDDRFSILSVKNEVNLSAYRITVDYPSDIRLIREVVGILKSNDEGMGMQQIVEVLTSNEKIRKINSQYKKKQHLDY